jgi:hypothetical protein
MPLVRVNIIKEVVAEASAAAAARLPGTNDWADEKQPYLVLRQRGSSVKWCVRGFKMMRVIGDPRDGLGRRDYLPTSAARVKAATVYAELSTGQPSPRAPAPTPKPKFWTWGDLDREYQAAIAQPRWVNRRRKAPAKGTVDDVRLALAKVPLVALHDTALPDLDKRTMAKAINQIAVRDPGDTEGTTGRRQREKCCTYVKSALTWAQNKKEDDSGLAGVVPWWTTLQPADPDDAEMDELEIKAAALLQAKEDFRIEHLAELLVRHEAYCAGREGHDRISPGIRYGIWWVAFTAHRRGSTVELLRQDLFDEDAFGQAGWGRAEWSAAAMKQKTPFWLPLPPVVLGIATSCMAEWRRLVNKSHGRLHADSKWVFASSRRIGRKDDNADVGVYANSLNRHLLRMKAAEKLDGLPDYWPHLTRSVVSNYLAGRQDIPPAASSLMLGHALPGDVEPAAPTTRKFYLTNQRMAEKAVAMKAWSDALVKAFKKAGGKLPGK